MNKLLKLINEDNIIYYFFIDKNNVFLKCNIDNIIYYVVVKRNKKKEYINSIISLYGNKEYFEKLEKNISKYENIQNVHNYILEMVRR